MKILVVEDDALVGFVLTAELTDAGYEVVGPAATAEEALQLGEAARPAVALVNIDLSGSADGVDVARVLTQSFGATCLFVTGNATEARAARDFVIGYIAKPCEPSTVLGAVEVAKAIMNGEEPAKIPHGLELFSRA